MTDMLTLTLKDGGKLDIPPHSIFMVEEARGKEKGCTIVYALTPQNIVEHLSDNYGFVKKSWLDAYPEFAAQALEVTVADKEKNRKLTIPKDSVIARKELAESDIKAKTRLTLNINGAVFSIDIVDARDTIVGE